MADELVRVRIGDRVKNVGASFARKHDLEVVDESPRRPDGSPRREGRANGRPVKKKTSVALAAAEKKATSAESDQAVTVSAETAEEASE